MVSKPARRLAREGAFLFGRATNRGRLLPAFLIAGAQRSGTSSLYRALADHPQVLPAVLHKGVHFFDRNYGRGLPWYRSHFPLRRTSDRLERRSGAPVVTFESSPYYLFHPLSAQRIAAELPEVKIITLVRDPVERAFSAHAHELARGYETEPFEIALELEAERTRGERDRMIADPTYNSFSLQHHSYLARSRYIEQFEDLTAHIDRSRFLVVDSHRLFEDPAPALKEVFDFLELEQPNQLAYDQHNARPRSPMDAAVRDRLEAQFRPYDERLAAWLGWTPRWMG